MKSRPGASCSSTTASDLAGYNTQELVDLLAELSDLSGTGYDQEALGELLEELASDPVGDDEPPPLPEEPETRPGDLLGLGPHRLLCADAREPESYARLMGEEQAELMWSDPPYGVSYQGKTDQALKIRGDGASGLEALLSESFAAIDSALSAGARLYVAHPAGELSLTFGNCFVAQGWRLRQTLVWVKDAFVLGRSDYHYRHEPILYGHKPTEGRIGRGARGWFGDNAQDSVLEVPRPRASREHPTAKPPELVELCLRNSTRRGDLVLDPFGGSGSTLVACEASGRVARLIELDPRFCDVIVGRWGAVDRRAGGAAVRCTAKTKAGKRCARPALRGRERCQAHSGERVGRPSALTPEVHARLVQAKQAGCPDWAARSTRNAFIGVLLFALPLAALQRAVADDRSSTVVLAPYTAWVVGLRLAVELPALAAQPPLTAATRRFDAPPAMGQGRLGEDRRPLSHRLTRPGDGLPRLRGPPEVGISTTARPDALRERRWRSSVLGPLGGHEVGRVGPCLLEIETATGRTAAATRCVGAVPLGSIPESIALHGRSGHPVRNPG